MEYWGVDGRAGVGPGAVFATQYCHVLVKIPVCGNKNRTVRFIFLLIGSTVANGISLEKGNINQQIITFLCAMAAWLSPNETSGILKNTTL